jgi:hypothetical protein
MRGVQEIIVGESPAAAIATLPQLLAEPADAARLARLIEHLVADPRILASRPTAAQKAMLERIRQALGTRRPVPAAQAPAGAKVAARKKTAASKQVAPGAAARTPAGKGRQPAPAAFPVVGQAATPAAAPARRRPAKAKALAPTEG